jgi:putative Ca2+/H+ antiporter (TMEM165/GDT1 family)
MPAIYSFLIIFLAEVGDKTQLLAIGFMMKYPFWKVIVGVAAATGILMFLAVLFGGAINYYIPSFYVRLFAALLFLFFGAKTLLEKEEKEEGRDGRGINPFWIVFSAFFLAEMGDKTQLGAFALTAKYGTPFLVWIGSTLGMVAANLLGALAGKIMHAKFSGKALKWIGGGIFILFGFFTLGELFLW